MFPKQTFVEYSDLVLGPWLGKFVSALVILWIFHTGVIVYNEVVGLFAITMLPNTPVPVLLVLVSLAPAYAVYHGLEVIGRSSDFLFFLILGSFLLIYLLLIPEFDFTELLPVFGDGIGNIFRSSLTVLAYAGEFLIVLFFYPYIKTNQQVGKIFGVRHRSYWSGRRPDRVILHYDFWLGMQHFKFTVLPCESLCKYGASY